MPLFSSNSPLSKILHTLQLIHYYNYSVFTMSKHNYILYKIFSAP